MKTFFLAFYGMLSYIKQNILFFWHRAKWSRLNKHNYTIAGTLFPLKKVTVGQYTYGILNVHSYNESVENLQIGNYCSIAGNVHFILSGEHNYKRFSSYPFSATFEPIVPDAKSKGPIIIEDDVWIGYGSIILSGVRLGKGSVVAAGSVISRDVPPYAVVSDNNRVIKYRFPQKVIEKLMEIDFDRLNPNVIRSSDILMEDITDSNIDEIIAYLKANYNNL